MAFVCVFDRMYINKKNTKEGDITNMNKTMNNEKNYSMKKATNTLTSNLQSYIENYLKYCESQKRLDRKTLKAYRIDLKQFIQSVSPITDSTAEIPEPDITNITSNTIEEYISKLHSQYKPKTVKRKIASIKSFFHYLEYKDIMNQNPFNKVQVQFREPNILPKTIPLNTVEKLLASIYQQLDNSKTEYQRKNALRDAAVIELLFSTGMRISELCELKDNNIDLDNGVVLIYGKGSKERRIHIGNEPVIKILKEYRETFRTKIETTNHFFINNIGETLSDQSVRRMINKYAAVAKINLHITPHMFRHTFATSLLEADVDIRYIQEMLGHSSINVTEIYTHVTVSKQKDILCTKHPRKDFCI